MKPLKVLYCVAAAVAAIASGHAQAQKSFLRSGEYLRNDQMLVSNNRAFFAVMQSEGNFVVYKGTNFQQQYGALWATGQQTPGQYFAIQQGDGNAVVYRGTGPGDNKGLAWHHQKTGPGGQFVMLLHDDGNLCTWAGTGPGDLRSKLWCSGATAAVTWVPDGKLIASTYNNARLFYGSVHRGPTYLQLTNDAQRWAFMPDGTVRMAADRNKCLHAMPNGTVAVGVCDGASNSTGWSYQAADKSIRSKKHPKGCLLQMQDRDGVPVPIFNPESTCPLDSGAKDDYKEKARWSLS